MTQTNPSYFAIKISDIPADQAIPFDIHVLINNRYILCVRKGDTLKKEKIASLAEKKIQAFHVPQEQKKNSKSSCTHKLPALTLTRKKSQLTQKLFLYYAAKAF